MAAGEKAIPGGGGDRGGPATSREDIFRPEAVVYHAGGGTTLGSLLFLSPAWLGWAYRLLVLCSLVSLVLLCLLPVTEFAEGPAEIRCGNLVHVAAGRGGVIADVTVLPGQEVARGGLLALLSPTGGSAEWHRILAPASGTVVDLPVVTGDTVNAGAIIAELQPDGVLPAIVAVFPERDRDRLHADLRGTFWPAGGKGQAMPVVISRVAERTVPLAVARPGPGAGPAAAAGGSGIVVEGYLPGSPTVMAGSTGILRVPVARRAAISLLLPGLQALRRAGGDHGDR